MRDAHGMGLSVEHIRILLTLLNLPWGIYIKPNPISKDLRKETDDRPGEQPTLCMCKVRIFHDFSKEEALLVIVLRAAASCVHVAYSSKARVSAAGSINRLETVPYPVAVLSLGQCESEIRRRES